TVSPGPVRTVFATSSPKILLGTPVCRILSRMEIHLRNPEESGTGTIFPVSVAILKGSELQAAASFASPAPDMLTVRIQAIDGARTFTPQDLQPCRLLPPVYASLRTSRHTAQNPGPSGSLILSREKFSFSASCRFIPAHCSCNFRVAEFF